MSNSLQILSRTKSNGRSKYLSIRNANSIGGLTIPSTPKAYQYDEVQTSRISDNLNFEWLKRAIYLSNNLFQLQNSEYHEIILYNSNGDEVVYFFPDKSDTISKMEPKYYSVCSIVYNMLISGTNITGKDMQYFNFIYKKIMEMRDKTL